MAKSESKNIKPKVKSFNCPNCGAPVEIKILGQTLNVVCPSCKSIIDANDPNFKILQKAVSKKRYGAYIPIGSRGKLHGVIWEVTGFVVKRDPYISWYEYLLFNPYHGYRWLVEVDGHFTLFKRLHSNPKSFKHDDYLIHRKEKFKKFNAGKATIDYVEGEFFWRVKRGEASNITDYIAPPMGISREIKGKEINWTIGHHVEAEAIQHAFKIRDSKLPYPIGVGALQPSAYKDVVKKMIVPMSWSILIIFAIQMVRFTMAKNTLVYQGNITKTNRNFSSLKTEPFTVSGGKSNIMLKAYAPLQNAWVYLDTLLVDNKTQKGIPISVEVSYYSGSDWSEGSRNGKAYAFNVPDGEYYLNIKPQEGGNTRSFSNVTIKLYRDVVILTNIGYALVAIIIGPAFVFFRRRSFEVKRWSNSDYSPYSHGE